MKEQDFINKIAPLHIKYAKKYGFKIVSAAIAQACLESAYGTSYKAEFNNYHGLKFRKNRVTCNNGFFEDTGSEQNADGSYTPLPSTTAWYCFDSIEQGVEGYYQFINIPVYSKVKAATDPLTYLQEIKNANYATSKNYVNNVYNVIKKWNLTQYDEQLNNNEEKKYYRVQVGAFKNKANAENLMAKIKASGFSCIIKEYNNLYKCQIGAFSSKANAEKALKEITNKGFNGFITYC